MRKLSIVAHGVLLSTALSACGGESPAQPTQGTNDTSVTAADGNLIDQAATAGTVNSVNDGAPAVAANATSAVDKVPEATANASSAVARTPLPTPGAATTSAPAAAATPPAVAATKVAATPPPEFVQCSVCHSTKPGVNGLGPSLAGIYGTKAAAVPGYRFSTAMQKSGLTWDAATLDRFLKSPRQVVPGTRMAFGGISDDAKRAAVVAYLKAIE